MRRAIDDQDTFVLPFSQALNIGVDAHVPVKITRDKAVRSDGFGSAALFCADEPAPDSAGLFGRVIQITEVVFERRIISQAGGKRVQALATASTGYFRDQKQNPIFKYPQWNQPRR